MLFKEKRNAIAVQKLCIAIFIGKNVMPTSNKHLSKCPRTIYELRHVA
jgi:hypothetical protein